MCYLHGPFFAQFAWNKIVLEQFAPFFDILPATLKDFIVWFTSEFLAETNIERYVPGSQLRFPCASKTNICLNKFSVSEKIQRGEIAVFPAIKEVGGQGVVFVDGSKVTGVDLIVLCTGYEK